MIVASFSFGKMGNRYYPQLVYRVVNGSLSRSLFAR